MRPDSGAGFSIGVYHTGQLPMLVVKGKGGSPSMEAGTNERIKIVRTPKMRTQNPDAGLECAVSGPASLPTRSPFVSSVQNGRGTIYRPAALGSCLPKTHSLADVQADWPKARIRFPLPPSLTMRTIRIKKQLQSMIRDSV